MFTVIAVSKPARRREPALASAPAVVPARTVHVSSSVAPFQLAYTTEPPAGFTRAATAGLSTGWPVQSAVKTRYDWSPIGNWPSSSSVPSAANSEKYGRLPQPTRTRPSASTCMLPWLAAASPAGWV